MQPTTFNYSMPSSEYPRNLAIEDIDAIGMQRSSAIDVIEAERKQATKHLPHEERDASTRDQGNTTPPSKITLSGLLNFLDGLISQEGRIVIMTSNFAHKLDKALIRPGRIDRQVYLGYTSPPTARLMFLRIFPPDSNSATPSHLNKQDLAKLATEFASYIPTDMLTPAEFQGHLIIYRDSAAEAVKETKTWVTEHRRSKEEEQEWAKRASLWKAAQKGRILTPEVEDKATKNKDEP
ncbi:hypothetical protein WAI453_001252 [Rhynchosporium graminicola]